MEAEKGHSILPYFNSVIMCKRYRAHAYGGRKGPFIYNLVVSNLNISDLDILCIFSFPDCCCILLLREGDMRADGSEKSVTKILNTVMGLRYIRWKAAGSGAHCLPTSFSRDEVIKEYFSVLHVCQLSAEGGCRSEYCSDVISSDKSQGPGPAGEELGGCVPDTLQLWQCIYRRDEESPRDPHKRAQSCHQTGRDGKVGHSGARLGTTSNTVGGACWTKQRITPHCSSKRLYTSASLISN